MSVDELIEKEIEDNKINIDCIEERIYSPGFADTFHERLCKRLQASFEYASDNMKSNLNDLHNPIEFTYSKGLKGMIQKKSDFIISIISDKLLIKYPLAYSTAITSFLLGFFLFTYSNTQGGYSLIIRDPEEKRKESASKNTFNSIINYSSFRKFKSSWKLFS